jgi:ribonuclease HI
LSGVVSAQQRNMANTQNRFRCRACGVEFQVPQPTLDKYPGWQPSQCLRCRGRSSGTPRGGQAHRQGSPELNLTVAAVLERYTGGPNTGLFTDGSASPNPGPGGWGVVYVVDGEIIDQLHGHEPHTTNNRMELVALIEAYKMSPTSVELDVWTDSELCVKTINEWAPVWESRGWRRKGGPIKNLELVQELYALAAARPNLTLRWIKAHDGSRWNEYADSLATAYSRPSL